MCENEIQIEIEKGNPKTIMNLNDKKNLINRDSVLSHQHCRIRLFSAVYILLGMWRRDNAGGRTGPP